MYFWKNGWKKWMCLASFHQHLKILRRLGPLCCLGSSLQASRCNAPVRVVLGPSEKVRGLLWPKQQTLVCAWHSGMSEIFAANHGFSCWIVWVVGGSDLWISLFLRVLHGDWSVAWSERYDVCDNDYESTCAHSGDASAMNVATRCLAQICGKQKAGALAHWESQIMSEMLLGVYRPSEPAKSLLLGGPFHHSTQVLNEIWGDIIATRLLAISSMCTYPPGKKHSNEKSLELAIFSKYIIYIYIYIYIYTTYP